MYCVWPLQLVMAFAFRASFTSWPDTCTALEKCVSFHICHLRHTLNILQFIKKECKLSMQCVALISMNQVFVLLLCNLNSLRISFHPNEENKDRYFMQEL